MISDVEYRCHGAGSYAVFSRLATLGWQRRQSAPPIQRVGLCGALWPFVVLHQRRTRPTILGQHFERADQAMAKTMYKSTETPAFEVERSDGPIQIRRYGPRIVAEVSVEGSRSAAIGVGFQILAGFIFGGNQSKAKVAMTSPVAQRPQTIAMTSPVAQRESDGAWVVQFTMPSDQTLETLPRPNDARIRLVAVPGIRQVAVQFSGLAGTEALARNEAILRDWAKANNVTLQGGPICQFYDAPFTLPWNRRNEIAFDIAP